MKNSIDRMLEEREVGDVTHEEQAKECIAKCARSVIDHGPGISACCACIHDAVSDAAAQALEEAAEIAKEAGKVLCNGKVQGYDSRFLFLADALRARARE